MKIYIRSLNKSIEVSKEVHDDYYRDINAYRRTQQNHGRCVCPKANYRSCDMDCYTCKYSRAGDMLSLDCPTTNEEGDEETMLDKLIDEASDTAEIATDQILLEALIKRMDELVPGIFRAFELRQKGLSDTEIAQEMDIPRTTLLSRMRKVTTILTEEFFENSSSNQPLAFQRKVEGGDES